VIGVTEAISLETDRIHEGFDDHGKGPGTPVVFEVIDLIEPVMEDALGRDGPVILAERPTEASILHPARS
jgi:hypothetical protein